MSRYVDSDDEWNDTSFGFKPLGGTIGYQKKQAKTDATAAAPAAKSYQSVNDIANKYAQKAAPPPAKSSDSDDEKDPFASKQSPKGRDAPKFGLPKPSSNSGRPNPMQSQELEDSIDSVNPGSRSPSASGRKPQQQPGAPSPVVKEKSMDDSSFFYETPFLPAKPKPAVVVMATVETTRYSYLGTKDPTKQKKRLATEENPSSEEETEFTRKIKPVVGTGDTVWNKSIEQEKKEDKPRSQQSPEPEEQKYEPTLSAKRSPPPESIQEESTPRSSAPASSSSQQRRSSPARVDPSPTRRRSPSPPSHSQTNLSASATFNGQGDLSRDFHALQAEWAKQEEESRKLAAAEASKKQQQQRPSEQQLQQNQQQQLVIQSLPIVSSPDQPHNSSITNSLDALNALQNLQSRSYQVNQANEQATREFLLNDSYYAPNVELHEVLADHKRLRQRLRAAQHAIEALAAGSEPGAVDGAASLGAQIKSASGSASNIISPSGKARRGYAPALQAPPSSLSMSQYAHLPPARAVLKLLHRLEQEESSFQESRETWRAEKTRLNQQMNALTADLRHLTSLAQQAHSNEVYFRRREIEHTEEIKRINLDRENERGRWKEIEKDLRDAGLRERIRFNSDLSKLERNDSYYKEKYDAVLVLLRKYEAERKATGAPGTGTTVPIQDQLEQQRKLFNIVSKEGELEKQRLAEQLQQQELKFIELQNSLNTLDGQREAELQSLKSQLSAEKQKRFEVEQQLIQLQHGVTRNLEEKLAALQGLTQATAAGLPTGAPLQPSPYEAERRGGQSVAEEYSRARESIREREREQDRERIPPGMHAPHRHALPHRHSHHPLESLESSDSYHEPPRRGSSSRGRSRSRHRVRYEDSTPSGSDRSPSPRDTRQGRSGSRGRAPLSHAHFRPSRVASAQSILSMLPANAKVVGDIEFVMPEDGSAPFYAEPDSHSHPHRHSHRRHDSRDDPHYAHPTFSSDHAAAIAERRYAPARSRSRSDSRSPQRNLRSRSQDPVRREVDRRVRQVHGIVEDDDQYFTPAAAARRERSRSRTEKHRERVERVASKDASIPASERVGPAVNGHSGVTIRVARPPATKLSAATKVTVAKKAARQAYHHAYDQYSYDRYGRQTEARGV